MEEPVLVHEVLHSWSFLEEGWVLEDAVASLVEGTPDLFLALALALASDLVLALALASVVEPIPSLVYPSLCF